MTTDHLTTFYKLLEDGQRAANWDGAYKPINQPALLPDCTHHDVRSGNQ
ncbi:MAG: hypothetical protein R2867_04395 [Caldilineaceae bacterium]